MMGYDGTDVSALFQPTLWPLVGWAVGVAILLLLAVLITSLPVRRRFWCQQAGREVEAAFVEDGPPGQQRYIAVVSCTAFEPVTHLRCQRSCLKAVLPTQHSDAKIDASAGTPRPTSESDPLEADSAARKR